MSYEVFIFLFLIERISLQKLSHFRDGYDRKVSILALTSKNLNDNLLYSRIIRETTTKSKDGRIDQTDFLNHAASSSRYCLFTPMEASIVFHFAGRGIASQRLSLLDFAQLLDPRWKAPHEQSLEVKPVGTSFLQNLFHSAYSFVQGGT
jgi:hypothetical protein